MSVKNHRSVQLALNTPRVPTWGHSLVNTHMVTAAISQSSVGALLLAGGGGKVAARDQGWCGEATPRVALATVLGQMVSQRQELSAMWRRGGFLISHGNHSIFRLENGK